MRRKPLPPVAWHILNELVAGKFVRVVSGPRGNARAAVQMLAMRGFIDSDGNPTPAGRHALHQHNAHKKRNG